MDVVTIGETMVLFTPNTTGFMRYANQFSMKFGGAESNVAIGLARLGHQVGWISKVGNDEFGKALVSFIKGEGVDVSRVKVDQTLPTGIYFKELRRANDVRVYYYRRGSAASALSKVDLDGEYIAKAKYLHVTGITPALSDSCEDTILEAIEIAKMNGVQVVFDPNLRRKLWSEEKARSVLLNIASKADIVLPGISEGEFMFGESDPKKIAECYLNNGASTVVVKLGAKGASYYTNKDYEFVPGYPVDQVVDPVGAGDGFAAGFLSGLLKGLCLQDAVKQANAVGAFVTTVNGDVEGLPDAEEIEGLFNNINQDVDR
ncbi:MULTISPECIES: sugar kinase [Metabacillus]|uniref:2-dehydro-3-deoxygluconokinase n=2 Tax=Metabacillus TaxID=2675233 RepID=A0A179SSK9_9BACI|nr:MULTISPECIES: sugar kinase [Metabacillus]OAS84737.1 2-dehydro-3-deoxygluconokinase [Metabacillus litoralis]QNF27171.1 sugar kinase [Metabacillus sp. KUDC1714]